MTNAESDQAPAHAGTPAAPARVGRAVRRDKEALQAHDRAAQAIAERLRPRTALDVGCGAGLLIEGLRRRGVDAAGIDPDPAALDRADPAVRPYLSTAPLLGPLPGPVDLAVCLEALAGLPSEEAAAAVTALCAAADDVLFAADPAAGPPPAYWAHLFAAQGFFRDVDFDAVFIAPWAARFRRRPGLALDEAVRAYETRFWELWEENTALREQAAEQAAALERLRIEHETVSQTLASRLKQWESIWADVELSAGWKFIHRVRLLRMKLAPAGSRRATLLRLARESADVLQERGWPEFFRHWGRGLRSRDLRFAPGVQSIEQRNAAAYRDYVLRTAPSAETLRAQRDEAAGWVSRPLISFITPVYKPPVEVLQATIDSVLAQSYERWELCLADASPDAPEVRRLLDDYAAREPRIRIRYLEHNLGICGNGNAALQMASGEFIAILDHDDVLAPDMLYQVVRRLQQNAYADVIYFDEDKLSEDGSERRDPFFKPDFSPEMLLSANYLTHAVYRRTLVEAAGGYDPAFEGCQDWDLAFKATERTGQVEHIPRVLYHWRQVSGSTAGDFGAKGYVFERQLRCVEDHLRRTDLAEARADFPIPGFLRASWPASGRKVSIVIPTKDKVDYLRRTVETVRSRTDYPAFEIVIVDNASRQPATLKYFEQLRGTPDVTLVSYDEKFNYSRANNLGASRAGGELLLFLNNDVEILHADWLEEMVRWADRPQVGVVGAKLLYPDDSIQHAGVVVGMEGHASHVFHGYRERQSGPFGSVDWYRNFTAITGACMMVRREVYDRLNGFDEKYILAFSDIEFCMRAGDLGYRVVYTPHARLRHYEGRSRGDHIPSNDIRVGVADFMPLVERGDPFYNPNLSYVERKPLVRPADEEDRVSRLLRVAAGARVDDLTRKDP